MSSRARILGSLAASVLVEGLAAWIRCRRFGGNLVVRCRQGHLFTTIWIPAVSVKALRLGWWRAQYCPVGHHWTVVSPVVEAGLSHRERRVAGRRHDLRIP